jgi:hypothetical protein
MRARYQDNFGSPAVTSTLLHRKSRTTRVGRLGHARIRRLGDKTPRTRSKVTRIRNILAKPTLVGIAAQALHRAGARVGEPRGLRLSGQLAERTRYGWAAARARPLMALLIASIAAPQLRSISCRFAT